MTSTAVKSASSDNGSRSALAIDAIAGARPDGFPLLDGLRGLAALGVFVFHGWLIIGYSDVRDWVGVVGLEPMRLLPNVLGHIGIECVAIFYAMSAFLLYRPWVAARHAGGKPPSARTFGVRRVARILPAYWFALVILGLLGRGADVFTAQGVRDYFFFGQIYHGQGLTWSNPVEPAWTICVEVTFYIFLPVWAALIGRLVRHARRPVRLELFLLLAVSLASIGWKLWAVNHTQMHVAHQPLLVALPASIDVFAVGMALALLERRLSLSLARYAGRLGAIAFWLATALFVLLCLLTAKEGPLGGGWQNEVMLSSVLKIPIAILLVIPAVIHAQAGGALRRLYSAGFACWVGVVSYGLYIWHVALLRWFGELIGRGSQPLVLLPVLMVAVLIPALGVAALSWYRIERPVLRRVHRRS